MRDPMPRIYRAEESRDPYRGIKKLGTNVFRSLRSLIRWLSNLWWLIELAEMAEFRNWLVCLLDAVTTTSSTSRILKESDGLVMADMVLAKRREKRCIIWYSVKNGAKLHLASFFHNTYFC